MNEQQKDVIRRINAVGARYSVHDETGEYVTGDTCDSLVFLHEANGKGFFLLRPLGWTNGEQYEHLVETALVSMEATLEPLHFRMVRDDGWKITFSPLNEEQKQDRLRWNEYKNKKEGDYRMDAETEVRWRKDSKRMGGANEIPD